MIGFLFLDASGFPIQDLPGSFVQIGPMPELLRITVFPSSHADLFTTCSPDPIICFQDGTTSGSERVQESFGMFILVQRK